MELGFQSDNVFIARSLAGGFVLPGRAHQQRVVGLITTAPPGVVETTRKSAARLPNRVARAIPAADGQAVQQAAHIGQVTFLGGGVDGRQLYPASRLAHGGP